MRMVVMAVACWLLGAGGAGAQAQVTVSSAVRSQTIEGWGHGSGDLGAGWGAVGAVDTQYVDFLTDDLGLTGTRITEVGPRTDGSPTDDGDCDTVDWTKFEPGPAKDFALMAYFKDRVRAEGYRPSFYSSTGYASTAAAQKPWVLDDPGERAQQIWANAVYWRDHYGVDIDYAVLVNEPGGPWTPARLADDIRALGPRLRAHGLKTRVQFPEAVSPQTAWDDIAAVQGDADLWPFVGRMSYHIYGAADPYRSQIRDFGLARGIPTAQTEMEPATVDSLFDDLTRGGVSYWEVSFSDSNTLAPDAGYTSFTPSRYYFRIRQVTHYVRPGAVRIGSESSDPAVRALAFAQKNGVTAVVYNTGPAQTTVTVRGLPPGEYGLSDAAPAAIAFQERGVRQVGLDGAATVPLGKGVVATLYPRSAANRPPTVMTWGASPGVIEAPATTATLAVSANDPEDDPLTFHWSVRTQPRGADAEAATPDAAVTAMRGLSVSGLYVFTVDVRDGLHTVEKEAYLIRYDADQPPVLGYTGFRLSAPYGTALDLPSPGGTPLHTAMALPVSSGTLQANVRDPENDPLTAAWTVVSQPPGADVSLGPTTYIYVSFRSRITNMTVPGDYVFQIAVTDGHSAPVTARVVCTIHPPDPPPVIASAAASPAMLTRPSADAALTVSAAAADDGLLRYWWTVKSAPPGAAPVFAHPGLARCPVSGLAVPGLYVFTVRVFDDIHMTTRDVPVRVL